MTHAVSKSLIKKQQIGAKLEDIFKKFQKAPVLPQYKPRLCEVHAPTPVWNIFYRQSDAIKYSQQLKEETFVFAVENHNQKPDKKGCRRFVVSTIEELWFYYTNLHSGTRHFYEVIQAQSACHLYFDLEFDKAVNPRRNGYEMVEIWIEYICECLFNQFGISSSRENVLELDSTTDIKFSQHLIWHCRNSVFKDNSTVGLFVRNACQDLLNYIGTPVAHRAEHWMHNISVAPKLEQLVFTKADGSLELFVDLGVYTKNRNFRLFLSSKLGKNTELKLSRNSCFKFELVKSFETCCKFHMPLTCKKKYHTDTINDSNHSGRDKLVFLASLITNVKFYSSLTVLDISYDSDCQALPTLDRVQEEQTLPPSTSAVTHYYTSHSEDSSLPFGDLENFVTRIVQQYNAEASVKKWSYFLSSNVVVYDVEGTRYCCNVQREHKSNRIMIVADLNAHSCYQKCYDPVCRQADYRSPPIPFPKALISMLGEQLSMDVDDETLIKNAEFLERSLIQASNSAHDNVSDEELLRFANVIEIENGPSQSSVCDDDLIKYASLMEQSFNDSDFMSDNDLAAAVVECENKALEDIPDRCLVEALITFENTSSLV